MKRSLWLATLVFLISPPAFAAPVLSCDEVNEMGEALTELGIEMDDNNAEIGEDSPEDTALRDVVDGLGMIAVAENDQDLADAADAMDDAWQSMDRDAFTEALAYAVATLAVISVTECEG